MANGRQGSATLKFLKDNGHVVPRSTNHLTHLLIDGGCVKVPEASMASFRQHMTTDVRADNVLCISENRTAVFPMYVDMDLKVPCASMADEVVAQIARVLNAQVQRFFEDRHAPFECIVCTKNVSPKVDDQGKYKHGMHVHWPDLRVIVDKAYEIRESMIAGLARGEWQASLGTSDVPWEEAVDAQVYSGGLRMVGAPKATKCPECKGARGNPCAICGSEGHIYDKAGYALRMVLRGADVDEERKRFIDANPARLLMATTVRCDEGKAETEGYRRYTGCPVVPKGTGSRKRAASSSDLSLRSVEPRFRRQPEVTDPVVVRVVRRHLERHSPHYANSRISIRFDGTAYRVLLTGEGANWCGNKNADHERQHVYMEIVKGKSNTHISRMRCWCKCPTTERRVTGMPCKEYRSPHVTLTGEENGQLFKQATSDPDQFLVNLKKELDVLHGK